jgi:tRNA-dihydrouridine synthase B
MIGRAAQGRPWLFREIAHELATGRPLPPPTMEEICGVLTEHLEGLYDLYGDEQGARVARKHIGWTVAALPGGEAFRRAANAITEAAAQLAAVRAYFGGFAQRLAA